MLILLFILLILAIYWEVSDYSRIANRARISELEGEDREKEYTFLSCFNYENNVRWRSIFIAATIATILIAAVLSLFEVCYGAGLIILVFAAVFVSVYGVEVFRSFHMYRPMCSKVKEDLVIL